VGSKVVSGLLCILEIPRSVLENQFGPGKSWKLKLKVLEKDWKMKILDI